MKQCKGKGYMSIFLCVKVCVVCSQGDYKNLSAFLAVWLQHHKLVFVLLHKSYKPFSSS